MARTSWTVLKKDMGIRKADAVGEFYLEVACMVKFLQIAFVTTDLCFTNGLLT